MLRPRESKADEAWDEASLSVGLADTSYFREAHRSTIVSLGGNRAPDQASLYRPRSVHGLSGRSGASPSF
jgi:hypothetical protein